MSITPQFQDSSALGRVASLVRRHVYLIRGSTPRLMDLFYWPLLQLVIWGFFTNYLRSQQQESGGGTGMMVAGLLVGAVLLYEVVTRTQMGVSISFLEEMWSRNLGHLFVAPLRPVEWALGLFTVSLIRALIGLTPAALLATFYFGAELWSLGPVVAILFLNLLIMGWWLGLLIMGLILRFGAGAENFAWMITFVLLPFCCVYYPLASLPGWMQAISFVVPATHVFEGMRTAFFESRTDWAELGMAFGLNAVGLTLGLVVFLRSFAVARDRGALLKTGE